MGWRKKNFERRKVDTPELLSLLAYHAFLFTIPSYVGNRLERLQGNILWSGPGDKFKFSFVDWNTMCSLISNGGMGVHKLGTVGFGFWKGRDPLVTIKYGVDWGGWTTKQVQRTHGRSLWKRIRVGWARFSTHKVFV